MFTVSFDGACATLVFNGRSITISAEPPRGNLPPKPLHVGVLNCENPLCGHAFIVDMTTQTNTKRFHSAQCRSDLHNAETKEKS